MFYNRRPTYNAQSPFGEQSMNVPNITSEILERLTLVEMELSVLMSQAGVPQALHKPSAQHMYYQSIDAMSRLYPIDGFDGEAFKSQIEPMVTTSKWSNLERPFIKIDDGRVNTISYMVHGAFGAVHVTDNGQVYATLMGSGTDIPVTKSNYTGIGLHSLFVEVFDKIIGYEKTKEQSNDNSNVIDKTALLESILRLTEHKVASLSTITALYACYRWYDCFERNAPLAVSFKEELIKNHTALRKIKERAPYMTQAFKNLEEAFSSLLHHDGSVDFIDSSYPIQSAIHATVDVLKSLISQKDE